MSDSNDSPLDLSGLDFGPSWAKDKTPARDYSKEVGPRESRDRRGKGPRREGGGRQTGDRRQQKNRREQRSDRGDRNERGDRRRNDRRGGGDRRQQREPRVEVPAPEGFTGGVMPVEEGLDNLSREIKGGGRTYSVFDLARVVMGARERFNVTFEAPKGSKFFRCKSDGSLWLTKEEATRHFWQANLLHELYEEIESEVEAPKGNFTSVAKCGLSGQWLAPPNYHSYPTLVARMHAERFSHLSLEDYKRKIRVENGEDVVASWLETQTKKISYRPLTTDEILALREARKEAEKAKQDKDKKPAEPEKDDAASENTAPGEEPKESTPEETVTETPEATAPAEAAPTAEVTTEEVPAEDAPETASAETDTETVATSDEPEASPAADLLADRRDVERHFADHHFKHIFAKVERAWVPGGVAAKLLSPALLTLLKATVADERRYPSKLTPVLCRQLSGRHLAVFKWKKKLKAGPARPHAVPDDIDLAERPQQMLAWIAKEDGKTLEELWKAVLPADADKETKQNFYHDFHWLLNQGFVLLMADSSVHLAKAKVEPKAESKAAQKAKSEAKAEKAESPAEQKAETPADPPIETKEEAKAEAKAESEAESEAKAEENDS